MDMDRYLEVVGDCIHAAHSQPAASADRITSEVKRCLSERLSGGGGVERIVVLQGVEADNSSQAYESARLLLGVEEDRLAAIVYPYAEKLLDPAPGERSGWLGLLLALLGGSLALLG